MDKEDIKARLRQAGYSLARAAKELGVTRQTLSDVLRGKRSQRVEAWIAAKLGLSVEQVWPERYPHLLVVQLCFEV